MLSYVALKIGFWERKFAFLGEIEEDTRNEYPLYREMNVRTAIQVHYIVDYRNLFVILQAHRWCL